MKAFKKGSLTTAIILFVCSLAQADDNNNDHKAPKLVLQITVDQLRGDLPQRYLSRMGEGGFRYLYDEGLVYSNAHHAHANNETIVGHTTLATGAHPSSHGMVGNLWFDQKLGRVVYNVEDSKYPLLSKGAGVNKGAEIDHTQKAAKTSGRSPANILVSTFGDELALASNGKAKVFGVSVKDRGAISMAGHAGKAFWFSKRSGEFVTSQFYYDQYPDWAIEWNDKRLADTYSGKAWNLLQDQNSYLFINNDNQEWETNFPGYGRIFPHQFGNTESKYFNTLLTLSPVGDELTLDFAKALMQSESIGLDDVTDYLSISFSSTDYVGHLFGPSSLEMEDNLLRLDKTLTNLFAFVDKKVGLKNTLIVLSADHGAPEAPGLLREFGIEANTIDPSSWEKEKGFANLKAKLGVGEELIESYSHPYVYLNHALIKKKKLGVKTVENLVIAELLKLDGVAYAVSRSDLESGNLPGTELYKKLVNNHNVTRSGDIMVAFAPHRFVNEFDGLTVASAHGSPWNYDTFVPVIFAGWSIDDGEVNHKINTVDIAPTLSNLLRIKPPSGADGQVLEAVINSSRD